ncbi:hypothetical protein T492DRAFT_839447 [Pavlovales sp. CCMP2436]|nr:hypothetical protein T492DRAFT_839447 [Pavlovales sp. CCMP2436]
MPTVEAAVSLLNSREAPARVRGAALLSAGQFAQPESAKQVEPLLHALAHPELAENPRARVQLLRALPPLLLRLASANATSSLRTIAAQLAAPLSERLHDGDAECRTAAAEALAELLFAARAEHAVPLLLRAVLAIRQARTRAAALSFLRACVEANEGDRGEEGSPGRSDSGEPDNSHGALADAVARSMGSAECALLIGRALDDSAAAVAEAAARCVLVAAARIAAADGDDAAADAAAEPLAALAVRARAALARVRSQGATARDGAHASGGGGGGGWEVRVATPRSGARMPPAQRALSPGARAAAAAVAPATAPRTPGGKGHGTGSGSGGGGSGAVSPRGIAHAVSPGGGPAPSLAAAAAALAATASAAAPLSASRSALGGGRALARTPGAGAVSPRPHAREQVSLRSVTPYAAAASPARLLRARGGGGGAGGAGGAGAQPGAQQPQPRTSAQAHAQPVGTQGQVQVQAQAHNLAGEIECIGRALRTAPTRGDWRERLDGVRTLTRWIEAAAAPALSDSVGGESAAPGLGGRGGSLGAEGGGVAPPAPASVQLHRALSGLSGALVLQLADTRSALLIAIAELTASGSRCLGRRFSNVAAPLTLPLLRCAGASAAVVAEAATRALRCWWCR